MLPDPGGSSQPVETTDAELWQRMAADDHSAFTELYERHAQAVWNYAYRLTASWATADDLLAQAFLKVWRRRADVRLVKESALPWLYTVTSNVASDERRRSGRFLRVLPKLARDEQAPDHADHIVQRSADQDRLRRVVDAIAKLPRSERDAVEVCLLGGTSTADAAELFGISEVSVRSRLSRARARLAHVSEEQPR